VLVLINGGIIAIDKLKESAPAIIEAFYPGYWGGVAIADVVFGDYNPGGKLPVTYYASDFVTKSDFLDMSMTNAPGRTYRYYTGTPLWEFGFGLSYTTFTLTWSDMLSGIPTVYNNYKHQRHRFQYKVTVTNTGKIAGDEVVLAFFKPTQPNPLLKQLFGFQRVHLDPNESIQLTFTLDSSTIKMGDQNGNFVSSTGVYEIEFTNGVEETLTTKVEVVGDSILLEKCPF